MKITLHVVKIIREDHKIMGERKGKDSSYEEFFSQIARTEIQGNQ